MEKYISAIVYEFRYLGGRLLKETGLWFDRYGSRLSNDIAWLEPLSRHRKIMPLFGQYRPVIYDSARIQDNASVIGQVLLGENVQVGYGAILRADDQAIRVGHNTIIGDNATILCSRSRLPTNVLASVTIGQNVTIGDNSVINSAIIDDNVTIGSRTLILDGAQIERGSQIGDDSVVPPGRLIPAGQLWAGSPVQFVRNLTDKQIN